MVFWVVWEQEIAEVNGSLGGRCAIMIDCCGVVGGRKQLLVRLLSSGKIIFVRVAVFSPVLFCFLLKFFDNFKTYFFLIFFAVF